MLNRLINRRLFLALVGAGALVAALPLTRWLLRNRHPAQTLKTQLKPQLRACLDTLLPADEVSPAATALGLDTTLLDELAMQPAGRSQLYRDGLVWCEDQARNHHGQPFAELDLEARDTILHQALARDHGSLPARFLHQLRDQAFSLYYSHPDAVASLPGAGPPQPLGYPDYTEPPA